MATQIAEKIAKQVAEKNANEYIQQNFPAILESHNGFSNNDFDIKKLEDKNEIK